MNEAGKECQSGKKHCCKSFILIAVPILVALILSGGLICAVKRFKDADRSVTVRGLAERDVEANLVIWPINWTVAANDLNSVSTALKQNSESIKTFLLANALVAEEIEIQPPAIRDLKADSYNQQQVEFRYSAKGSITVRTDKVSAVKQALTKIGELIKQGIVLGENGYLTPPVFTYTELNSIKPGMIEDATKNAREAAAKFAADSGSSVGKIKRATQGLFEIFNRDGSAPDKKTVRVVTTVEYSLGR